MGRRKKNATVGQDVKSFTETKEDSLSVFAKEQTSIPKEVVDLYEVKPVGKSNLIGGARVEQFNGKTYKHSLDLAHEWRDNFNKSNKTNQVKFINYYPQMFQGKSILIGYTLISIGENNG